MLWASNATSLRARYGHRNDVAEMIGGESPPAFKLDGRADEKHPRFSAIAMIKSIQCFQYQACEYEEWAESGARKLTDECIIAATHALAGHKDAHWGSPFSKD